MARKSKIETSPHFNEIVDLLVAGYSGRYVSNYLFEEYGEKISHTQLNKYKKDNLNVKAAVKKKVIEKEKTKKQKEKKEKTKKKLEHPTQKAIEKQSDKQLKVNESFEAAVDIKYKSVKNIRGIISQSEKYKIDLTDLKKVPYDKKDYYKELELILKIKKLELEAIQILDAMLDDDNFGETLTDGIIGLAESIEKSRQKYLKENQE